MRSVQRVTPHLIRVTIGGEPLAGFTSPGFDDHAKLFFPDASTGELTLPRAGPDGPIWPEGRKPTMRDYTPGRFDAAAGTLEFDLALHDAGPARPRSGPSAPSGAMRSASADRVARSSCRRISTGVCSSVTTQRCRRCLACKGAVATHDTHDD
ncbi:hypothetical protein BH11PSE13_BH11PSE13_16740 [soil metagenome]